MTVTHRIDIQTLAKHLANAIADFDAPVAEVWTSEYRGDVLIWIITKKVELDRERLVYHALAQVQDAYPDQYLDFQVYSPMNFPDDDIRSLLPSDIVRMQLPTDE